MFANSNYFGMQPEPPKSPTTKWTDVAGISMAAATLLINCFRDSDKIPWLKYLGWPASAAAVLFLGYMVWKNLIGPWRRKRAALRLARSKIVDLPDYIRRFKADVVHAQHSNGIAYQVSHITLNPNDATTKRPDAQRQSHYVGQMLDRLLERLESPVKGLPEIVLIFELFDDLVRYVLDLYRDEWKPFLRTHRARIHDDTWAQCIKAREYFAKFIDDYRVFRKAKEKDADAIGSGFHFETPDPLVARVEDT
jgi:hypothetical protein